MSGKKQAVVVVHGMGEQQPMQTIRDFVKAVWMKDPKIEDPHFWNKPSSVSKSFEQRRLTTNTPLQIDLKQRNQRVDFYEYYWAHHTVGTKMEHLKGWILALMLRNPRHIWRHHKRTLLPILVILWLVFLLVMPFMSYLFLSSQGTELSQLSATSNAAVDNTFFAHISAFLDSYLQQIVALLGGLVAGGFIYFLVNYFGDVARYVNANPANINIRQNIRQGGIELLERIHATGEYDRVILVGHSLGSIIAYDMLNHLWARHNKFPNTNGQEQALTAKAQELCDELVVLSTHLSNEATQSAYREKQHALFMQLKNDDNNNNWLISDFITLGSPLTYADVLLFQTEEQFMWRKLDREYATSPPVLEENKFYYGKEQLFLHHAAVFAPVRWSNIYSKTSMLAFGDIISGPVGQQFLPPQDNAPARASIGPVKEIQIRWDLADFFTHTKYWQFRDAPQQNIHLEKLRDELNFYLQ